MKFMRYGGAIFFIIALESYPILIYGSDSFYDFAKRFMLNDNNIVNIDFFWFNADHQITRTVTRFHTDSFYFIYKKQTVSYCP